MRRGTGGFFNVEQGRSQHRENGDHDRGAGAIWGTR